MTIMYLTFGQKTEYHLQAYLSMLSFRRQTTPQDRIVMVTTTPELYRHARSWADIVTISDDEVSQWKGRHQYMFRVKTMAMRQLVEAHPDDHLLFVDTDTVLYGDLQQMRAILDRVELSDQEGVCLDTYHIWDGGYDIVDHLDDVLAEFDDVIGLDRLFAVHLNDSLNPRGSHKDRHAKIGEGEIGLEALVRVINHPQLRTLPFILETPNDHDGYAKEIALLRSRFTKADGKK